MNFLRKFQRRFVISLMYKCIQLQNIDYDIYPKFCIITLEQSTLCRCISLCVKKLQRLKRIDFFQLWQPCKVQFRRYESLFFISDNSKHLLEDVGSPNFMVESLLNLPTLAALTSRLTTKLVSDPFLNSEGEALLQDAILRWVIFNERPARLY